jgi:DUF1680 family protein
LYVRIPEWCSNPSVLINGTSYEGRAESGEFLPVRRKWGGGDSIELRFPMAIKAVEVDDSDFANKRPIAIEMGPLLYSLKIEEEWKAIEGTPMTKLPDDWSWFEATPLDYRNYSINGDEMWKRYDLFTWNYALVSSELPNARAVEYDTGVYPWEDSPVKIRVAMKKAKYCYPIYPTKTIEVYEHPIDTMGETVYMELVPYGCTTLRISYFPAARETRTEGNPDEREGSC